MRLDLDASCNENGPILSSYPTQCFLVTIIVKCRKFMMMEAQTLIDFGAPTCFMDKKLVQQYKLVLLKNNTLMPVGVIGGQNLSLRPITHKTKPLDVTIGSHISKVILDLQLFVNTLMKNSRRGSFDIPSL